MMTANGSGSFVEKRVRQYNPHNRRPQVATIGWSMRGLENDVDSRWWCFAFTYVMVFQSYSINVFLSLSADTAALICLSFTNACVVSTIIIFRCGRMAPPHSKMLGLKHVIVHFRNEFTQ